VWRPKAMSAGSPPICWPRPKNATDAASFFVTHFAFLSRKSSVKSAGQSENCMSVWRASPSKCGAILVADFPDKAANCRSLLPEHSASREKLRNIEENQICRGTGSSTLGSAAAGRTMPPVRNTVLPTEAGHASAAAFPAADFVKMPIQRANLSRRVLIWPIPWKLWQIPRFDGHALREGPSMRVKLTVRWKRF